MDAANLHDAIAAVCPIVSVRVGKADDRSTWSFVPAPEATPAQIAAGNNVLATVDPVVKNVIAFDEFIRRWDNAEYRLLMQNRAASIQSGSMGIVKQWDIALARGAVDLNKQLMQSLKSDIVAAGILTQARADAIFA